MSEDLTEGMDTSIPGDNSTEETTENEVSIPEGFDDTLYDVDTKSLRIDEVKKRFDADKKEIENYKKQALDMRRKLSKGADIPDIIERFHNLNKENERTRKDKSFFVPVKEIRDNDYDLTINKYKEVERPPVNYRSSTEILADIKKQRKETDSILEEIEAFLTKSGE